ncbi:Cleavage and polyadenylation specificity factor subunit 4 [Dispira parvispora]|uniref:mRNA 3'-end-processing protein n=1 Tax=Dispira parvispora TaxID=1520584 RepID=A0A9W8AQQ6_9FUNG|nr:Cleavage and polyadenylation specificity factor subunit 4 [Dispira parvispora]
MIDALSIVDVEPLTRTYRFDFEDYVVSDLGLALNGECIKSTGSGICKYFLKGACRKGNSCQYRHTAASEKSVVCKHWIRGLCKKGDQCEFLHVFDKSKMPECHFFKNFGYCGTGKACMYLHIDPNKKVNECAWYARGFCKHGPKCRNKHVRRVPCQNFITGFCPLGPDCPNVHPRFDIPTSNEVEKAVPRHTQVESGEGDRDSMANFSQPGLDQQQQRHDATYQNDQGPDRPFNYQGQQTHQRPTVPFIHGGPGYRPPYMAHGGGRPNRNFGQGMPMGHSGPGPHQHRPLEDVTCFKCGEKGHYANHCPQRQMRNNNVM